MCRCVWRKGYVIGARGQRQVEQGRCTVIVTTSHDWQLRHSTRNNRDAEANRYVHNLENIIYNNLWRLFYIKLQNNKHLILTTFKRWNGDLQVSGRKTEQYISTSIEHCNITWMGTFCQTVSWSNFLDSFLSFSADTFHKSIIQKTQRFSMQLGATEIN